MGGEITNLYDAMRLQIANAIEQMKPGLKLKIKETRRDGLIKRYAVALLLTSFCAFIAASLLSRIGLWFGFMGTLSPFTVLLGAWYALYVYENKKIDEDVTTILGHPLFSQLKNKPEIVQFTSYKEGDEFPFQGTSYYLHDGHVHSKSLTWCIPRAKPSDILQLGFITISLDKAHVIFCPDRAYCLFCGNLPKALINGNFGQCFARVLPNVNEYLGTLKELVKQDRIDKAWNQVVIDESLKNQIQGRVDLFSKSDPRAPRGILLAGPPGTGKSLIAKCIAESAEACFVSLSLPDLKAANLGESAQRVREVWNNARSHTRTILFIDECEGAFGKRGSITSDKVSAEIVESFLAEWDGLQKSNNVLVIGATNRKDLIDPAILSRFGAPLVIDTPNEDARRKIIEIEAKRMEVEKILTKEFVDLTSGMSGRDLRSLIQDIATTHLSGKSLEDSMNEGIERFRGRGSSKTTKKIKLDDVVLQDETKSEIRLAIDTFKNIEKVESRGFEVTKTMLLYGPPGTGKTEIARAIANEGGLSFLSATTSELKGAWIGHSAQQVRELFEKASGMSPCVLCLDELEVVAPSRNGAGSGRDQFTDEIVGELIQQVDGVKSSGKVFILGITNYPEKLDSAVLSRFSRRIEVPLPDALSRQQILERLVLGKKIDGNAATIIIELAEGTEGRSGRELRDLVRKAEERALARALKNQDLENISLQESDFHLS